MTPEQIKDYKYCETYLDFIQTSKTKLPFGSQKHGCGSNDPKITFTLERIHRKMWESVSKAIRDAEEETNDVIKSI